MKGCFSLVLHSHMPYVRKNGAWPVGEDWLYQVMSETYIPLLGMLAQLEEEDVGACLGLTLTPVLCEQLADPYIQERFIEYLKTMEEHSQRDINDFVYFDDGPRKTLAEAYSQEYRRKRLAFTAIGGDILGALASFEEQGMVETITSSATHSFLPGLTDERSVRQQISLGIESHERRLGVRPRGFWIPECAYRAGIEEMLAGEGIDYFIVDSTALGDRPAGRPYLAGGSTAVALARSDRAHLNAWDEDVGYPTDDNYMDSTKYYQGSGLHYWRVTGPGTSIDDKEVYEPGAAHSRALDHARHFIGDIGSEVGALASDGAWNDPPLVLASYDTEFLGHGWKEGFYWLEITLRSLEGTRDVKLVLPSRFLDDFTEREKVELLETTWGTDRDQSTWLNPDTDWMWSDLARSNERMTALLGAAVRCEDGPVERRALEQAARELMLLESSDWPYMVAKDRASDYAIQRFRKHFERFETLADAVESHEVKGIEAAISEIEEADNIFAGLDLGLFSSR